MGCWSMLHAWRAALWHEHVLRRQPSQWVRRLLGVQAPSGLQPGALPMEEGCPAGERTPGCRDLCAADGRIEHRL